MHGLLRLTYLHKSKHLSQSLGEDNTKEEHDSRHLHTLWLKMNANYARFSDVHEGQQESSHLHSFHTERAKQSEQHDKASRCIVTRGVSQ